MNILKSKDVLCLDKAKAFSRIIGLIIILIIMVVSVLIHGIWCNTALETNTYDVDVEDFKGSLKVAHVSDLHNTEFGENNQNLIEMLTESEPDIIAITGDIVDGNKTDIQIAVDFAKQAVKIAPCYFVSGNHEYIIDDYDLLKNGLRSAGVTVMQDGFETIDHNGQKITLVGLNDMSVTLAEQTKVDKMYYMMKKKLSDIVPDDADFVILLSHRPGIINVACVCDVDVVLSGHTHGGQIRLPFVGGLYVPSQGFFPDYVEGMYVKNDTHMIVSRGLGNSVFPLRINNRPELVIVNIK